LCSTILQCGAEGTLEVRDFRTGPFFIPELTKGLRRLILRPMSNALDIDMYQASMLRGYFKSGMHNNRGAMELFARKLPAARDFFVVSGIARVVDYLNGLKFTDEDIRTLKSIPSLEIGSEPEDEQFVNWLASIDFKKELTLYAFQEGNVAFPHEPLLRVEGPIGLCQFVEKRLLSIMNHDVRVASKAARIALAAKGRAVFEFGGRRAHEGCSADTARAAYIAGCAGSSNVQAYQTYGVPAIGTMGHVWIMSHETEAEAFENWSRAYKNSVYLIDTYNPTEGVHNALKAAPGNLGGVRLDSGDLLDQSCQFKRLLTHSQGPDARVVASNDLDEYSIATLLERGAAIDAFGVGTQLVSTPDTPSLNFVYKLVSVAYEEGGKQHPICKVADGFSGKGTWPGAKQVKRHYAYHGNRTVFTHDVVELDGPQEEGDWDNQLVKHDIVDVCHTARTELARKNFAKTLAKMPGYMKVIPKSPPPEHRLEYPVDFSEELSQIRKDVAARSGK